MLVLPGALTRNPGLIDKLGTLRLPALQHLLARGRPDAQGWTGIDAWLMEKFQVERQLDWPGAPYCLLGEGVSPGDACWVHADPVWLRPDRDRLLLADASQLNLRADEAAALAATINAHFGGELELHTPAAERWYARLETPPGGETMPLAEVAGRAIEPGRGAMGWHALMNEMQMLLHEHPVNEAREARGEAPVNGIWLWGAGRLAPVATAYASIATTLPLARGLARHAGIGVQAPPGSGANWLAGLSTPGVHVCINDALTQAVPAGAPVWVEALARLESDWIAPLLAALEEERLGMLTLRLAGARTLASVEATRQDLRRFWRRAKPLGRTLGVDKAGEEEAA